MKHSSLDMLLQCISLELCEELAESLTFLGLGQGSVFQHRFFKKKRLLAKKKGNIKQSRKT